MELIMQSSARKRIEILYSLFASISMSSSVCKYCLIFGALEFKTTIPTSPFLCNGMLGEARSQASGAQVALCSVHLLMSTKLDRKSTRLNSSHVRISYAVFCL